MHNDSLFSKIREGAEVIGSDGDSLGKVDHVEGDMFVVRKGFFFPQDHQIPMSAVTSVDDGNVYLSVTGDAAMEGNWSAQNVTSTSGIANDVSGLTLDPEPFAHEQDSQATHINANDELLIPVIEEDLVAGKHDVQRGEVRISKDVVEEQQTLEVPVTEEEVEVTRRRVDRDVNADDHAFEEGTIEVPLRGEEVNVEKRTRVVEEIDVDKTAVTHNEQVTDTVRREEVTIEGDGPVERDGRNSKIN